MCPAASRLSPTRTRIAANNQILILRGIWLLDEARFGGNCFFIGSMSGDLRHPSADSKRHLAGVASVRRRADAPLLGRCADRTFWVVTHEAARRALSRHGQRCVETRGEACVKKVGFTPRPHAANLPSIPLRFFHVVPRRSGAGDTSLWLHQLSDFKHQMRDVAHSASAEGIGRELRRRGNFENGIWDCSHKRGC